MAKGIGSGVISEHSVTFELHTGQKYGCDGEQTAVQVEHKLSVSNKPMLASMQSSQLVSEVVDDVDINDVDIDDNDSADDDECVALQERPVESRHYSDINQVASLYT